MSEEMKNDLKDKLLENDALKHVPGGEEYIDVSENGFTRMRCHDCYYMEDWQGYHVDELYKCPKCGHYELAGARFYPA